MRIEEFGTTKHSLLYFFYLKNIKYVLLIKKISLIKTLLKIS